MRRPVTLTSADSVATGLWHCEEDRRLPAKIAIEHKCEGWSNEFGGESGKEESRGHNRSVFRIMTAMNADLFTYKKLCCRWKAETCCPSWSALPVPY